MAHQTTNPTPPRSSGLRAALPHFCFKATPGALAAALLLSACGGGDDASAEVYDGLTVQPTLGVRSKSILTVEGKQFRDLNGNGKLDLYEDWRRSVDRRVDDLVAQMTLQEKAGLMLIQTLNGGCGGSAQQAAFDYINAQKMHRFILRNVVNSTGTCAADSGIRAGSQLTPQQAKSDAEEARRAILNPGGAKVYTAFAAKSRDLKMLIEAFDRISQKPKVGAHTARGCGEVTGNATFTNDDGEVLAVVRFGGYKKAAVEWTTTGKDYLAA